MKKILIILDGGSGLPHYLLGGKTPLESAKTLNLDWLAFNGKLGYMYPIDEKTAPGSDNSIISLLGNDPKDCKRGVYEALGLGIKLKKGDLALRTNFGTIDNLKSRKVIDRRAGRTLTTKEAKLLEKDLNKIKLECDFEFKSSIQHRGVLVLRGNFSENITNIDPEWSKEGERFKFSKPLDEKAQKTSEILNDFIEKSYFILKNHKVNLNRKKKGFLPANILFARGGGNKISKIKKYKKWMSINSMPLEIGISKSSGMKTYSFKYPDLKGFDVYKNLYNGLEKSIKFSIKKIKKHYKNYSGCYIQFKETDIPGHDNKPFDKKRMIEIIDKKFFGFLRKFIKNKEIKIIVTCDHSTPCKLKKHSPDPVPVLVYNGKDNDKIEKFCEKESKKGSLGKIYGKDFMKKTGLDK